MTQKTEFCNIKHNLASNAKLIKKCVCWTITSLWDVQNCLWYTSLTCKEQPFSLFQMGFLAFLQHQRAVCKSGLKNITRYFWKYG